MTHSEAPQTAFAPRRLGHANLFVRDLEKSVSFYNTVCGLELVRREAEIAAGFLTNGNTHHDLGLMQAQVVPGTWTDENGRERTRIARDRPVGLNHLGWEMDNEAQLVEAWRHAKALGVKVTRTLDHQISRSVYIEDPDGNHHEFYADTLEDWRSVFNLEQDDVVTKVWDPETVEPNPKPLWIDNPDLRTVPDAHFHADFITHAGLVASDYRAMQAFFRDVAGLQMVDETDGQCLLRGPAATLDLVLFAPREGVPTGLRFIAFVVADDEKLSAAQARAEGAGLTVDSSVDEPERRSVTLRDPDGLRVLLYTRGSSSLGMDAGTEIMKEMAHPHR